MKTAWDLGAGQEGRILRLLEDVKAGALIELGCLPGARIAVIRKVSKRGPVYLKINHNMLALRRDEARLILLQE